MPLSAACTEVAYDITRAQPQLFVARDFEQLEEVLRQTESTLSVTCGGARALREAALSQEVATLRVCELDGTDAVGLVGVVEAFDADPQGALLRVRLRGPLGVLVSDKLTPEGRPEALPERAEVVVSRAPASWRAVPRRLGDELSLTLSGGVVLRGTVTRLVRDPASPARVLLAGIEDARLGDATFAGLTWIATGHIASVRAGSIDPAYYPASGYSKLRVPGDRSFPPDQRLLMDLYEEAHALWRATWGTDAARTVASLLGQLDRDYPDEWLLRCHLLEVLLRAGERTAASGLKEKLERLELRFAHREPIALGLRRLARLAS